MMSSTRTTVGVLSALLLCALLPWLGPTAASAQNGLSDERVSLPDGPGSIGGVGENVEINANMGSSAFAVRVEVPQGITDAMTPSLALSYASGMGMGNAGIGWQLRTPTIERTVNEGLPEYSTDDQFAVDGGSELVFVGTAGGAREYRERFEGSFVRYRWHTAGAGAAGYWTAEYPDGRTGYFGADASGSLVATSRVQAVTGETFRYHLVEVVDSVGRRLVHSHIKDSGWVLLDEVQYGFGGMATPRFSVRFVYEDRPDVVSNATPGYEIQLTKRLGEIRVRSESTTLRSYALDYESAALSGGLSRLQRVTQTGRDGGVLPIQPSFGYSRTLGGVCGVDCERPFMVDMGTLPGGASLATGRAQLIDINGDSLPDVVTSSESGEHTFFPGVLSSGLAPTFGPAVTSSMTSGGSSLVLGSNGVQLLDVNGDGFVDAVNQISGEVLCNDGSGDWTGAGCLMNATTLPDLTDDADADVDPQGKRFFDFDNDKRIDLLVTAADDSAQVFRNTGTAYAAVTIDPLGETFDAASNLQLADMNGDGLQDPVRLVASGAGAQLSYRINLGRGRWTAWRPVTLPDLPSALVDDAELEDLDGDGLADIVVVASTTVQYWRNENAGVFSPGQSITSADVTGVIPERTGAETVVFADMNGNGTDDVVWVSDGGAVRFLELSPVRPNLLSRIENGIGWVRELTYGTSISERARDEGTADEWVNRLPYPINVVTSLDTWVTLTGGEDGEGVHELREFAYHDGYYDGAERDFRGFQKVERMLEESIGQEPGRQVLLYDVGVDDVYRNGLLVRQTSYGGPDAATLLQESRSEFDDCLVTGAEGSSPPIRFICEVASVTIRAEGAAQGEWATLRTERDYDGYGNVIEERALGVVHRGPPEAASTCGACDAPAGLRSGACGAECLGDERIVRTSYVVPGPATDEAWLLRLPSRERTLGVDGGLEQEVVSHYDGPDFVGLAQGEASRGLLTRTSRRLSATEEISVVRNAYDTSGNLAATLDPNGDPDDASTHRRDFERDARGLRVIRVTVRAGDYDLVQDVTYESSFLKVNESTAFRVVNAGEELTPRNSTRFRYDEFGRVSAIARPGDSSDAPSESFEYELGDPVTRVVVRRQLAEGEAQAVICQDGRARTTQTRRKISDGRYLVDGFRVLDARGQVVRIYQPYEASSDACEATPPVDVPFEERRYDSLNRPIEATAPDASLFGSASVRRTDYGPLTTSTWDSNDTDASSPHASTPRISTTDGLGRTVRIERMLADESADYRFFYDELGNLSRAQDPANDARVQTFDLLGRALSVEDPNSGTTTYAYDAAGNVVRRTDARGEVTLSSYDGLNRIVERWRESAMMETLERTLYDYDADCADCRNGAGRVVRTDYPLPTGSMGSDENAYDPRGRRVLLRRTLEGHAFETAYQWDLADRLVRAVFPDGQALDYAYDLADRPLTLDGVVDGATYTDSGRLASLARANGTVDRLEYDVLDRVSRFAFEAGGGAFVDASLTRDRVGNALSVNESGTGAVSHGASYDYDAWYRLTSATVGADDEELTFGYDLADNLTERSSSLGMGSSAHLGALSYGEGGAGPNAVTTAGATSYGYDMAGQMTSRGSLGLTWDHRGRLAEATTDGVATTALAYAPTGERVVKLEEGGVSYYAAPDFVVRDGVASLYPRFGSRRVARLRTATLGTTLLTDANADGQISVGDAWLGADSADASRLLRASARRLLHEASDAAAHLHTDVRSSVVASTDSSGGVIAERAFYPFGLERSSTGYVDEHGFTGQELDEQTQLLHFRFRYLDPMVGRWTSVDPAFGILSGANISSLGESTAGYAYVANNPLNVIDPDGLKGKKLGRKARRANRRQRLKKRKDNVNQTVESVLGTLTGQSDLTGSNRRDVKRSAISVGVVGALVLTVVAAAAVEGARAIGATLEDDSGSPGPSEPDEVAPAEEQQFTLQVDPQPTDSTLSTEVLNNQSNGPLTESGVDVTPPSDSTTGGSGELLVRF